MPRPLIVPYGVAFPVKDIGTGFYPFCTSASKDIRNLSYENDHTAVFILWVVYLLAADNWLALSGAVRRTLTGRHALSDRGPKAS